MPRTTEPYHSEGTFRSSLTPRRRCSHISLCQTYQPRVYIHLTQNTPAHILPLSLARHNACDAIDDTWPMLVILRLIRDQSNNNLAGIARPRGMPSPVDSEAAKNAHSVKLLCETRIHNFDTTQQHFEAEQTFANKSRRLRRTRALDC